MGMGPIRCHLGFSTRVESRLEVQLERHAAAMETTYSESFGHLLLGIATLHDAVDAALAGDAEHAVGCLDTGIRSLSASNDGLSALGESLVRLRADLFENPDVPVSQPLIAREPFFAALDYDALHRELAQEGAVLPNRAFWNEAVSRIRDGGARAGVRLLERHLRTLQGDLRRFIASVEAIDRRSGQVLGEALHGTAIPTARVFTGYTRLITTFGYVSFICERATLAYERAAHRQDAPAALAAG